jgi:hypothetical protein
LDEEERGALVDVLRLLPRLRRDGANGQGEGIGGVVHDEVELAVGRDRLVNEVLELVEVTNVAGDADGLSTNGANVRSGCLAGLFGPTRNDHFGTRASEAEGNGSANSSAPAGHDGDVTGEVKVRGTSGVLGS